MMDIEKLIEQLNEHVQSYTVHDDPDLINTLKNSATALSTLQAENERLRTEKVKVIGNDELMDELQAVQDENEKLRAELDRLRELVEANREGRCVILPCKKGDVVWRIVHDATPHIAKDRCTEIALVGGDVWVRLIGDMKMGAWNFGHLLFTTRSEAEAALRRERDE